MGGRDHLSRTHDQGSSGDKHTAGHYRVARVTRQWIEDSHMVLAYALAALVLVHSIGALRHHFLKHK